MLFAERDLLIVESPVLPKNATVEARPRQEREKLRAHPNRDASGPKCVPQEVQAHQPEIIPNRPRRIPPLCSTTDVCWRKPVSATGLGAVIRRLLPTSAVLCRPPSRMPYRAVICRLSPTFADRGDPQRFLSEIPSAIPLIVEGLKADGPVRHAASALNALFPALLVERGYPLRGEIMVSLMTENEVSKRLNVSLASLRRWRLLRRGPAFLKLGSLVRYSAEDLEAWLASLPTGETVRREGSLSRPSARQVESGK